MWLIIAEEHHPNNRLAQDPIHTQRELHFYQMTLFAVMICNDDTALNNFNKEFISTHAGRF